MKSDKLCSCSCSCYSYCYFYWSWKVIPRTDIFLTILYSEICLKIEKRQTLFLLLLLIRLLLKCIHMHPHASKCIQCIHNMHPMHPHASTKIKWWKNQWNSSKNGAHITGRTGLAWVYRGTQGHILARLQLTYV